MSGPSGVDEILQHLQKQNENKPDMSSRSTNNKKGMSLDLN
jgi:hypothetical protein